MKENNYVGWEKMKRQVKFGIHHFFGYIDGTH